MKKILAFIYCFMTCIGFANAAVRDENATERQSITNNTQTQNRNNTSTQTNNRSATVVSRSSLTTATKPRVTSEKQTTNLRSSSTVTNTSTARTAATPSSNTRSTTVSRDTTKTNGTRTQSQNIVSRAAIDQTSSVITGTKTGAEYEKCKTAYFTCMDQFCQLKNDDYRRCSCSNRVFELSEIREVMQDASEQLTVFTENLDVVGMTAAQATAMKTATEGENALTSDTSASKALLQAIMNSIRGEDSTVGGKFSDLNSINIAFNTNTAFGNLDAGQTIATYDGQNLYSAVYPQCREAVKADCTDAQLQRAVTAYLMAIEQDCNTVESALEQQQKEMKSAVRESSALLDLARVENRQKHNSDDMASCLANVESAILSEEVCGSNYHKCLDNGEFIDVSTGAPIEGVENFYELGKLLTFTDGVDASDQKLSKISANRIFVQNFEKKVKKFAEPALDKCTELADDVWDEYLDKALLEIYYAQQSKVNEIKEGCFDLVSSCYMKGEAALTEAMKDLIGDSAVILQPDKITLSTELCQDYINSCNMMFYEQSGKDIITDYVNNRKDTDTLTACRAVLQQCFTKFGGSSYENFYYPYSGLFTKGNALSWFTLYEYEYDENNELVQTKIVSECAKQLTEIASCNSPEIIEKAFGGFDVITASKASQNNEIVYYLDKNGRYNGTDENYKKYGLLGLEKDIIDNGTEQYVLAHHVPRSTGVATELYYQIIDMLSTQCENLQGRFLELQFIKTPLYNEKNLCVSDFKDSNEYGGGNGTLDLTTIYSIGEEENMCPRDYELNVDIQSWGACLCWENGGRRSKYGQSTKCVAAIPVNENANDAKCNLETGESQYKLFSGMKPSINQWCTKEISSSNQVCPLEGTESEGSPGLCIQSTDQTEPPIENLPEGVQL